MTSVTKLSGSQNALLTEIAYGTNVKPETLLALSEWVISNSPHSVDYIQKRFRKVRFGTSN